MLNLSVFLPKVGTEQLLASLSKNLSSWELPWKTRHLDFIFHANDDTEYFKNQTKPTQAHKTSQTQNQQKTTPQNHNFMLSFRVKI